MEPDSITSKPQDLEVNEIGDENIDKDAEACEEDANGSQSAELANSSTIKSEIKN